MIVLVLLRVLDLGLFLRIEDEGDDEKEYRPSFELEDFAKPCLLGITPRPLLESNPSSLPWS